MSEHTFVPATVNEYLMWVWTHLEAGGKITHWYDYPMSRADILVAQEPFELSELYGASSKEIIVPEGVEWICPRRGHSNLYLPEGRILGRFVPVYIDEAFHDLPDYRAQMSKTQERSRKFEERNRRILMRLSPDSF